PRVQRGGVRPLAELPHRHAPPSVGPAKFKFRLCRAGVAHGRAVPLGRHLRRVDPREALRVLLLRLPGEACSGGLAERLGCGGVRGWANTSEAADAAASIARISVRGPIGGLPYTRARAAR